LAWNHGHHTRAAQKFIEEGRPLPLPQLEALAEALLDFTGPDDLADWLDQHAG
jgi:hypothetical protein